MINCRKASQKEVTTLIEWAAREGWNPGYDDASAFYAADPDGFVIVTDNDQAVAGLSVIRQGSTDRVGVDNRPGSRPDYGFLGLYLCKPEYRGRGLGWLAWQAGMEYLAGCTVGLDGVVDQQANYRKSGFELSHRNIRYSGAGNVARDSPINTGAVAGVEYRPVANADIDSLLELDRSVGGVRRDQYLRHWFSDRPSRRTVVALSAQAATDGSNIAGVGTIRQCVKGYKIGPLICENTTVAKGLIFELATSVAADEIIIDVPEPNAESMALVESLELRPVFETARMYRGTPPQATLDRLYGVCTLELG